MENIERIENLTTPRETVVLDFTKCNHDYDCYDEMQLKMEWEYWYGHNLSALWDILTGMDYRGDDFIIIRPRKFKNIRYGLDDYFTSQVDKICQIFVEAQEEYHCITVKVEYVEKF